MPQVQLNEDVYKQARRRAAEEGFESVDEYVEQVLSENAQEQPQDFDYVFTPERIAHLDKICADLDAGGKTFTPQELEEHLDEKRAQWLKDHAS